MEIIFLFKDLSKDEESVFADYVNTKKRALETLLTKFSADAKILNATIRKFDKHSAYEVEFCLNIPSKAILAKETSHTINKAVDLTKDRLVTQIKKHLSTMNRGRQHRSIKARQKMSAEVSSDIFSSMDIPN